MHVSAVTQKRPVSIHAPAGGATRLDGRDFDVLTFQSTRPRGARQPITLLRYDKELFQSTRPRGARRGQRLMILERSRFQSTRPRGARLSHHNSLIRRTVPAPLREPNACCQQRQTSKVSPGTNTLSINRLDMREPIRQSMSTWGSPQTGRPAECGMGQMVPRRSADHGSRRTALHRYARPYVASSGPGNRSEGCQPQGQSTPATDP